MKVVILAGDYGTRLSEETVTIPKPLVEIGDRPLIWHIMKLYSYYGLTDFIVCCGYKGHMLKRYFLEYAHTYSDITVDLADGSVTIHRSARDPWRVTLVDTGEKSMTGGRVKRVSEYITTTFCMTYGDGIGDIDISALVALHRSQSVEATVTAVLQPGRFGALDLSSSRPRVSGFREKSPLDGNFINGGFFVLEPSVMDLISGDDTVWEQEPLRALVAKNQLAVYRHQGFWQNMDTLRDK